MEFARPLLLLFLLLKLVKFRPGAVLIPLSGNCAAIEANKLLHLHACFFLFDPRSHVLLIEVIDKKGKLFLLFLVALTLLAFSVARCR